MVKVNHNGHWTPILMDDKIPVLSDNSLEPFVLRPETHDDTVTMMHDEEFLKSSPKKCKRLESKVKSQEIWPQIVTKALAKSLLNYERMLQQNLNHYLRMLTGMPVKDYPIDKIEYGLLRLCFKREHIVIAHGNNKFLTLVQNKCSVDSIEEEEFLKYWNVGQVIELEDKNAQPDEELSPEEDNAVEKSPTKDKKKKQKKKQKKKTVMWVELVNPYCKNNSLKGNPTHF